eukprot:EST46045.1 Cyclase homology and transmembrane domain-containing protein [Spironucleus salmonicida]
MLVEIYNQQPVINAMNQMASTLMTSFVNALPSKLLPLILQSKELPCDIVPQVIYIYIHLKTQDELLVNPESDEAIEYLSRINSFYCILDFLTDICGVQKIKSSYSYYMACTGAQYFLESMNGQIPETSYSSQYQQQKLMTFFALSAQEVAKAYQLECACGITKGNIVVGVLGLGSANVNLDTYGDTINTAARIARNADRGVHIAIDSFINCPPQHKDFTNRNDQDDNLLKQYLGRGDIYNQAKQYLLLSQPYYLFGKSTVKQYKGKGNIRTIEIFKEKQFIEMIYIAFKKAYIPFTHDVMVTHQQTSPDEQDLDLITNYFSGSVDENDFNDDYDLINIVQQQSFTQSNNSLLDLLQFSFQSKELEQMLNKDSPVESALSVILTKKSTFKLPSSISVQYANFSDCFFNSNFPMIADRQLQLDEDPQGMTKVQNLQESCQSSSEDLEIIKKNSNILAGKYSSNQLSINQDTPTSALKPQFNNFLEMARLTNLKRDQICIQEKFNEEVLEDQSQSFSGVVTMHLNDSLQSEFEDSFFQPAVNLSTKFGEQLQLEGEINTSTIKIQPSAESISQEYQFPVDQQPIFNMQNNSKDNVEVNKDQEVFGDEYPVDQVFERLFFSYDRQYNSVMIQRFLKFIALISSLSSEIQKQYSKNKSYLLINIQSTNQWMFFITTLFLAFSTFTEILIIMNSHIVNTKIQIMFIEVSLQNALYYPQYFQMIILITNISIITQLMLTIRKQKKKNVFQNIKSYDQVKSVGQIYFYNLLGFFALFCVKSYIILNQNINVYLSNNLQISLLTLQILQILVFIISQFSFITMPQFFISRTFSVTTMFIFIFLVVFLQKETFLASFMFVVYLIIVVALFPLIKLYFGNILINIKAIQQINNGRQLLRSVLPHITIDSLLATSSPELLKRLLHSFPFLHKYQDTLLLLKNMGIKENNKKLLKYQSQSILSEEKNQDISVKLYRKFNDYLSLPNTKNLTQTRPVINFDNVAYLNLDIANFTQFSTSITVEQMMSFLDNLFHKFDTRISKAKNLIQIKISGDSYELMSLPCTLKIYTQDYKEKATFEKQLPAHLQKLFKTPSELRKSYDAIVILLAVGLGFIHDCKETMRKMHPQFENLVSLRVGIAYGNVIGSLLGHKLCRFDAFGKVPKEADTVQSNARLNSVAVSQLVFDIISYGKAEFQGHLYDVISQMEVNIGKAIEFTSEYVDFDYFISNQQICVQQILSATGHGGQATNSESCRDSNK